MVLGRGSGIEKGAASDCKGKESFLLKQISFPS